MAPVPPDALFKIMIRLNTFLFRISGGRLWKSMLGMPVLLLTTPGRKSGQPRTTPVVYVRGAGDYVVAGSKGGSAAHPAWYLNLAAASEAQIEVGGQKLTARVALTQGVERDQLYEMFKSAGPHFATYEQNTTRVIPVVRLTPV